MWEFLLYVYLISTGINLLILPIKSYLAKRKHFGIRRSIFYSLESAFYCFLPIIGSCALIYLAYCFVNKGAGEWIKNDPTSPENIADLNFNPPPKKKLKPIRDRFEILDL